jgi:hypothetical protein
MMCAGKSHCPADLGRANTSERARMITLATRTAGTCGGSLKDRVGLSLYVGSEGMCAGGELGRPLHVAIATSPALEHRLAAAPCTLCAVDSSRTVRCAVRDVRSGLHAGDARGSRPWRAGGVTGRRTMGRVTGRRPVEAGCTRVGEAKARRR